LGAEVVRVLLVEDSAGDARLARAMLDEAYGQGLGPGFVATRVARLGETLTALARERFDVVLLDLLLPDSSGLDTLTAVLQHAGVTPVVVMSGMEDYRISLEAVKAGAQDYLVKGHVDEYSLPRVIQYAIERGRLQEALQASQRAQSIAVLAGGLAHDFNNLLTSVLTQNYLARSLLPEDHAAGAHIEKASQAAQRATELTRQLLAYVGKGKYEIQRIEMNALVNDSVQLVSGLAPQTVRIEFSAQAPALFVRADRSQLQQAIVSLLANALEAMPAQGGLVSLTTSRRDLEDDGNSEKFVTQARPLAGEYACLAVMDTGVGMDQATMEHIFDPFFSTKFTGRGLGLAATLGIVRGHRGGLQVRSQAGAGSTFTVWLPTA